MALPPGGTGQIKARQVRDRAYTATVLWRDDAGGYHRTKAQGTTKKQCEDLARQRVEEARRALATPSVTDLTLAQVADRWFEHLQKSSRRGSTIEQYRATWRGTLCPVLGDITINTLSRVQVQQVLREGLFARRPGRRGDDGTWIPGSYRLDATGQRVPLRGDQPRQVMRQLLRFAADWGYRTDGLNVLDGTEPPERRTPTPRALTVDESERLLELARTWHLTGHGASDVLWHGLVVLQFTGLRIGELLALAWDDICLQADPPTITVRHTLLEQRGSVGGLGPTKNGETAVIALHERAVDVLRSRRAGIQDATGFVFATSSGKPVTAANFRRSLRDLVRNTDLDWVHPHTFRHTLGTRANAHHDLDAARDLLRHKDDAVTRRHYVERNHVRVLDPRAVFEHDG